MEQCGIGLASKLCHYGFGDSLFAAAVQHGVDSDEFMDFLVGWREDLKNALRKDPSNLLKSKQQAVASRVGENFPDLATLFLYTNPTISPPSGSFDFTRKALDLRRIGAFGRHTFAYRSWALALEKFERTIFSVVVAEALQQIARDAKFPRDLTGYFDLVKTRRRAGAIQFCVQVDCRLIISALQSGYDGTVTPNNREQNRRIWVHGFLLARSHPHLVSQYYRTKRVPNPFQSTMVCLFYLWLFSAYADWPALFQMGDIMLDVENEGVEPDVISVSSTEVIDLTDD